MTKQAHSTESRACRGLQLGMLYWPPGLTLLNSGSPWSLLLLLLAWPRALHNHGRCSNPSLSQCSNQQQLVLASVLCQLRRSKQGGRS